MTAAFLWSHSIPTHHPSHHPQLTVIWKKNKGLEIFNCRTSEPVTKMWWYDFYFLPSALPHWTGWRAYFPASHHLDESQELFALLGEKKIILCIEKLCRNICNVADQDSVWNLLLFSIGALEVSTCIKTNSTVSNRPSPLLYSSF